MFIFPLTFCKRGEAKICEVEKQFYFKNCHFVSGRK